MNLARNKSPKLNANMKLAGLFLIVAALVLHGCNNIDDASPSSKNTFVKFIHGPYSYSSVEVEVLPDGYAILGNQTVADDSVVSMLIRTDTQGNQVGETAYFPGNTARAFEVLYNGDQVSGYLVVGDSIYLNPAADKVGNIEIYSAKLLQVDINGNITRNVRFADLTNDPNAVKTDFKSSSVTVADGHVILLGTYKEDLASPEKPFIVSFTSNLTPSWFRAYSIFQRNYVNSRSVHVKDGKIIWASAILKPSGDFKDSYLAIPYIEEESTFENFSQIGETSSQLLLANDIQPSGIPMFGFGVVGKRGLTDGSNANMIFVRVDASGNFIPNSERYFDAAITGRNEETTSTTSENEDEGTALTATADGGYVLAGSTQQGSEERDIFLVKVTATGVRIWSRVLGGDGDESVSSIREEADGSLVICGTNNLSGLSSVFLIRTDKNGELKN